MDKQKVNTTSSMKELKIGGSQKGYSSSFHYRIKPVVGQSEQVRAVGRESIRKPQREQSLRKHLYGRINQIVELKIDGRSESQIPKH